MGGDGVENASLCRVGVRACSGEDGVVDACTLARESGKTIALTHCEFALLGVFVCGPGRALTRDMLLDATCHRRFEPFDRSVDVRVGRLRRKIEPESQGVAPHRHSAGRGLSLRRAGDCHARERGHPEYHDAGGFSAACYSRRSQPSRRRVASRWIPAFAGMPERRALVSCRRSEVIQGPHHAALDCFVASLLAITIQIDRTNRRGVGPTPGHTSASARSMASPNDSRRSSRPAGARNCTPVGIPSPSAPEGRESPHMRKRLPSTV